MTDTRVLLDEARLGAESAVPSAPSLGYEALGWALLHHGIRELFCLMGDANLEMLAHASGSCGIRLVHARHEQGAVAMADGYARATGRLGVCSVTAGPGLTNAATSLVAASRHESRVVLIAGDTPVGDRHNPQRHDQRRFAEALGIQCWDVRTAASLLADIDAALRYACGGHGPVLLSVPIDVQHSALPETRRHRWRQAIVQPVDAPPEVIERAALALSEAHRPTLLVGRGAVAEPSRRAVLDLAEALGAPIVATLPAKGIAFGHRLDAGVAGALGQEQAGAALRDSDVICALGTALDAWTIEGGRLVEHSTLIHIDTNPERIGHTVAADIAVIGDAGRTASALAARIRRSGRVRGSWWRATEPPAPAARAAIAGPLETADVVDALDDALQADRVVVLDGGHFAIFTAQRLGIPAPEQFFFASDFGAIGQGLGVAIGVAFGRPGSRVTAIVGDGCLMMALTELDTVARYGLPLTIVVMNDNGLGHERHSLVSKGFAPDEANVPAPDFVKLADAVGIAAHQIDSPRSLSGLAALFQGATGPLLIEVKIDGRAVSPVARKMFDHVRAAEHQ